MTKTNNIAFQGVLGAYSHMACQAHCPDLTPLPCASFSDMIAMVQDGGADCAMVPVENSTAGRVADIHHLLPESGLFIIAEHYQPVAHKLLGIKGAQLSDITEVHSHEQGLAQCRITLQKMGIKPVIHSDTAGAAKDIAARGERHVGAIASALAGDIYGLDTVQDTITDKVINTTRFLIMSRERVVPQDVTAPAMTTIIFEVRSVPAVLYKALGGFATNGINLTKLESYMLDGSMNAARFYVDCEGHPETDSMKLALEELQFYCTDGGIRILGTYLTNR
jgi:prephenate dehydratase